MSFLYWWAYGNFWETYYMVKQTPLTGKIGLLLFSAVFISAYLKTKKKEKNNGNFSIR